MGSWFRVEGDGGGLALVPYGLGDGEVEQDHSFGAARGLDDGLAQDGAEARGTSAEKRVEVGQVVFLEAEVVVSAPSGAVMAPVMSSSGSGR